METNVRYDHHAAFCFLVSQPNSWVSTTGIVRAAAWIISSEDCMLLTCKAEVPRK